MKIDESCINHNAVRLIQTALDTYLIYADDKEQRPDAANVFVGQVSVFVGQVAGILTMARVLKEVLRA